MTGVNDDNEILDRLYLSGYFDEIVYDKN